MEILKKLPNKEYKAPIEVSEALEGQKSKEEGEELDVDREIRKERGCLLPAEVHK